MAQEIPPGAPAEFLTPSGKLTRGPDGKWIFSPSGPGQPLVAQPAQPAAPTGEEVGGMEFLQTLLEGGTMAAGMIPGGMPLGIAGKTLPYAIPAVMGMGALKGAVDPEATSMGQAAFEGGMEAGSRVLGKGLPYAGTRAGLAFGGLGKAFREKQPEITQAYMRAKDAMFPKGVSEFIDTLKSGDLYRLFGLPIGRSGQMEKELGRIGHGMEAFEKGRPEQVDLRQLLGGADELLSQSGKTPNPMDVFNRIAEAENKSVGQHIAFRNPPRGPQVSEVPRVDVFDAGSTPAAPATPSDITDLTMRRNIGRPGERSFGPEVERTAPPTDVGLSTSRQVNPNVSFREAGEIKRGYTGAASDIYKRSRDPGFDPVSEEPMAKLWAAMGDRMKQLQEAALSGDPTALKEMQALNQQFSDLALMLQSTSSMRGGGKIFSDPGAMATRGSLAAIPGGFIGRMLGMDPWTTGAMSGAAGAIGGAPKSLSAMGMGLGNAARMTPTLQRGQEVYKGVTQQEKSKTRRRKPGER